MRIKKTSNTRAIAGKVVNVKSDSTTDAYSCDYINKRNTYSTDEVFTGKYWIDGKPIYRKYLSFNLSTTVIYNDYKHNISDIDYIIKVEGSAYDGHDFYIMPAALPSDNVAKYGVAIQSITKTDVHIYSGTENKANNINVKMFVYYTKTTD